MRRFLLTLILFASLLQLRAQDFYHLPDSVTGLYLDTVVVKKPKLNDYIMIGAFGGASLARGYFNPDRYTNFYLHYPVFGVSIVKYSAMFGIFPNMGTEFGAQLDYEGYQYQEYESNGKKYRSQTDGAYEAWMRVPEVFLLSHFHAEFGDHFKGMLKIGLFGGYRLDVHRSGPAVAPEYVNGFTDHDRRATYGARAGAGFGLVFEPIEIHLMANLKWGWSPYYEPDYYSPYYYRYAYPLDLNITLGVYFQLTKRYGRTRSALRKMAREAVEKELNPIQE